MASFQMLVVTNFVHCLILENEIDGDAFLALTEDMVKPLIPKIGPRAKFLVKHKKLLDTLVNCCIYTCSHICKVQVSRSPLYLSACLRVLSATPPSQIAMK